jgi:hypothetical protein
MKLYQLVCVGAVLAAGVAQADQPAPNAQALGITEALVGFCAKMDPDAAGKLDQIVKQMLNGQSDQALADLRGSDEYKLGHDSVDDFVAKVDEHNAKKVCANSLAEGK